MSSIFGIRFLGLGLLLLAALSVHAGPVPTAAGLQIAGPLGFGNHLSPNATALTSWRATHPAYNTSMVHGLPLEPHGVIPATSGTDGALDSPPPGLFCDPYGMDGGAEWQSTADNIQWLSHRGNCVANARSCVRTACSYNSAIFLCNDNYDQITPTAGGLPSGPKTSSDGAQLSLSHTSTWFTVKIFTTATGTSSFVKPTARFLALI